MRSQEFDDPDEKIEALFVLAKHENQVLASASARKIAEFGALAFPYIPRILDELPNIWPIDGSRNKAYASKRSIISDIYDNIEPDDYIDVDKLLEMMETSDLSHARSIFRLLKDRTDEKDILNRLLELARHENNSIQRTALGIFRQLDETYPDAISELIKLYKDSFIGISGTSYRYPARAISSLLVKVEPRSDISVDLLLVCLEFKYQPLMKNAAEAIKTKTGSYDLAIKKLRELQNHEDPVIRRNASRLLEEIGNQE